MEDSSREKLMGLKLTMNRTAGHYSKSGWNNSEKNTKARDIEKEVNDSGEEFWLGLPEFRGS